LRISIQVKQWLRFSDELIFFVLFLSLRHFYISKDLMCASLL
jgi:hypothetical protein